MINYDRFGSQIVVPNGDEKKNCETKNGTAEVLAGPQLAVAGVAAVASEFQTAVQAAAPV